MDNINSTYLQMLKEQQNNQLIKKQKRLVKLEKLLKDNNNQFGHRIYNSNKENYRNEIIQLKKDINNLKMGHTGETIPEYFQEPINNINYLLNNVDLKIQQIQQLLFQIDSYKDELINISHKTNTQCSEMARTIQKISDLKRWINNKK